MQRYLSYMKYVTIHRWFVMVECFREGLIWQGLIHDLSKYRPTEFIPYAKFFYDPNGIKRTVREKSGYYKPTDTGDVAFDYAWLLHQKRNKHHWQWWILPEDEGGIKTLSIPANYIKEMICDWRGAGRAQGVKDWQNPSRWYEINKHKMQLHGETRKNIEMFLGGKSGKE